MRIAEFPDKFQPLFVPKRHKVYYGGRGGAKSWAMARALLILGTQRSLRVLCVRELQNSISESVHKLLSDQIEDMGLQAYYEVQKTTILSKVNGTTFNFEGIRNNVNKIKSYEGIDVVWAEEAAQISKNSWDILIPTIRKPGSEIWISFNPEEEEDETYQRFVIHRQPNSIVMKVTWRDNPWFPQVLRDEMEACKARNYDDYLWIWEGNCRQVLDGSVYKHEVRRVLEEDRVTSVPYVRGVPVDVTLDIGRSDHTSMWFRQSVGLERRYIDFLQDNRQDVDYYVAAIRNRGYNIGTITLPHDAKHQRFGMKYSVEKQFRDAFPSQRVVTLDRERKLEGIYAVRRVFPQCFFDMEKCAVGWTALRKYSYELKPGTAIYDTKALKHDEYSDAADAFRYDAITKPGAGVLDEELAAQDAAGLSTIQKLLQKAGFGGESGGQGWLGG